MNKEELREAVEKIKGYMENDSLFTDYEKDALPVLVKLAEKYLEASDELPVKKEVLPQSTNYRYGKATQRSIWFYNEAIDLCTPIVMKMKEEIADLKRQLAEKEGKEER